MAKDWAFTKDGDLDLGDPEVNAEGATLYKHLDGTINTDEGEDGKAIRDIGVVEEEMVDEQIVLNRLRTDMPDWYHHPVMGGNLTDLIGEPNTRDTAARGEAYIRNALTYKSLYNTNQITVRAVPISVNQLVFMIDIYKFSNQVVRFPIIFSLETGLMDIYKVAEEEEVEESTDDEFAPETDGGTVEEDPEVIQEPEIEPVEQEPAPVDEETEEGEA